MNFWDRTLCIGEETYDLSHLAPFYFEIVPEGFTKSVKISVTFHNHCFTEEVKGNNQPPLPALSPPFVTKKEGDDQNRFFSRERYELSRELRNVVSSFEGRKVAQTRHGDFVVVTTQSGQSYGVFFNLRQFNKATCDMFILSAYPLAPGKKPAVTKEMRFKVAVAKIMQGKAPHFPQ
jgi:hypothetical protein